MVAKFIDVSRETPSFICHYYTLGPQWGREVVGPYKMLGVDCRAMAVGILKLGCFEVLQRFEKLPGGRSVGGWPARRLNGSFEWRVSRSGGT